MKLFQILTAVLVLSPFAYCQDRSVDMSADYLEYDEAGKEIYAKGRVRISSGNFVISGDEMRTGLDSQYINMKGSVTLSDNNYYFDGQEMNFDIFSSTGEILKGRGNVGAYYFNSNRIVKEKEVYCLERSKVSTCDLHPPHYYLRISKSKLVPGETFYVHNLSFWLKGIPFLYIPYVPISLRDRSDCWWITPGSKNGSLALKIIYGFPVTKESYMKLYFDELTTQGIGWGAEYNYNIKEERKGTFYGYYIDEQGTGNKRWSVRSVHWQKLSPEWIFQGDIEVLSDPTFNSYYFTESWDWMKYKPVSKLGVTRQTGKTNLSIYTMVTSSAMVDHYGLDKYILPRIEFTVYPAKLFGTPLNCGFSTVIEKSYTKATDFSLVNSTSDVNVFRELKLTRSDIITPRIGLIESYQDRASSHVPDAVSITKSYYELAYRRKFGSYTNLDLNYKVINRFRVNTWEIDARSDDSGVDSNFLSMTLFTVPADNITLRFNSGYDLRRLKSEVVNDWMTKLSPLSADINWGKGAFGVNFRYVERLSPYSLDSVQTLFDYTANEKTYFNFGLSHQYYYPGIVKFTNSFALWLSKKWHIGVSGNFDAEKGNLSFQQRTFKIYRDLHCWEATLTYNIRRISQSPVQEVSEYFINFGMKTSSESRRKLYDIELEQDANPWRKPE